MKKNYLLLLMVALCLCSYAQQTSPAQSPLLVEQAKKTIFSIYITDTSLLKATKLKDGTLSINTPDQKLTAIFRKYKIYTLDKAYPASRFEYMHLYYRIETNSIELMSELMAYSKSLFQMGADETPEVLTYTPNDYYNYTQNTSYLDYINATTAYDITKGSGDVVVGVTDTYFDSVHTELCNKIIRVRMNLSMLGNHGTAVAGVLAGETDNTVGFSSVGFKTKLDVSSVLGSPNEMLNMSNDGRRILNGSWKMSTEDCPGSYGSNTGVFGWQGIFNEIYENGTLPVFSAGNGAAVSCGSTDANLSAYVYPASLDHCFSVTAVGHNYNIGTNNFDQFGNYGAYYWKGVHRQKATDATTALHHNDRVDLSAPGYNIPYLSTPATTPYKTGSSAANGTSFSAPMVSGTAALMLAINPALSPYQMEWILKHSANPDIYSISYNTSYVGKLGAGRLDAGAAVAEARDFICDDAATQTFRVTGIEISSFCKPGFSTMVKPKLIPHLENGVPPYSYKWEPIPGGSSMTGNSTSLDSYNVAQPSVIAYGDSAMIYYRLTVTDNSPVTPKVASKLVRMKLLSGNLFDLVIMDSDADTYTESNDMMVLDSRDWDFWNSPGIWNRKTNDSLPVHEAPGFAGTNYINVLVKNIGCVSSKASLLGVYYTQASVAGNRKNDYDSTGSYPGFAALKGGKIGEVVVKTIPAGKSLHLVIPWNPPAALDTFATTNDLSFYADINTKKNYFPVTTDTLHRISQMAKDTNHAVIKNEFPVLLHETVQPFSRHRILVGNSYRPSGAQNFTLQFINDKVLNPHLAGDMPAAIETTIKLSDAVYAAWIAAGAAGTYLSKNDVVKSVTFDGRLMELKHISMPFNDISAAFITFKLKPGHDVHAADYRVYFRQLDEQIAGQVTGVGSYLIHTEPAADIMTRKMNKEKEQGSNYTVYPNPLSSLLNIEYAGREKDAGIQVFDVVGRIIIAIDHVTVGFSPVVLDMGRLPAGVYIIDITDENGRSEKVKVVKQ